MSPSELRIGLTYDLRDAYLEAGFSDIETAEFDRADTIESIEAALVKLGYRVDRIGHVKQLAARLVAGDRWDLVFNICEGMHGIGREAQVPALLDAYQIPYVFSDTLACALTLHKGMTKDVVRAAGVATPDYAVVHDLACLKNVNLPYPLFAKPIAEGTGKGISANSKITNATELQNVCRKLLKEYKQPVLVERFLPGREFTVGILGTGRKAAALATLEIELLPDADAEVYSYNNKENCEELVKYKLLPSGKLRREVESLAVRAWRALGCRDAGRIDVRLDDQGQVSFIEVNPLAGIHPEHSDLPIMATMIGVEYTSLIGRIMNSAVQRCSTQQRTASLAA
ncbi:MAG: ATP-grasp domain-containing protein [Gammaproteobacteria bacterium]|nr:ATP-grasp domain-containing protein [Gammaproteobacteria bacterium]MDH4314695.1 ATP-grasp domain-containing protein [Gammaproteobacteria bacterium]MDH5214977.1 ATP-grasp domain-containing protein [Gammaproteobacteria bacterium]